MENVEKKLQEICHQFNVEGRFVGYEHIKVGNVNQTYMVVFLLPNGKRERYCLQRINTYAFRNPEQLMNNVLLITDHMHDRNPDRQVIHYQRTLNDEAYVSDREGMWRMYNFIPAVTYSKALSPEIVYETGKAFGLFQRMLSDFDSGLLYETIPEFHNTPRRIHNMMASVDRDPIQRARMVRDEIRTIAELSEQASLLHNMRVAGELPVRVTHNDTKLNNVLFDEKTNTAITVIDLDTVMPGLIAYDFGDAVRFMANTEAEDSKNWQQASCDMEIFRGFAEGFLAELKDVLTEQEINTLSYAPFVLSLELASRFLDDFLLGDAYFNTEYDDHNLDRTRCQLQMAKDCLAKREEMHRIILECVR